VTHLTYTDVDRWATIAGAGRYLVRVVSGERMPIRVHPQAMTNTVAGPAIVELVVFRDGGWTAREMHYETPESIAVTASAVTTTEGDTAP
jgi:hypothetical protein